MGGTHIAELAGFFPDCIDAKGLSRPMHYILFQTPPPPSPSNGVACNSRNFEDAGFGEIYEMYPPPSTGVLYRLKTGRSRAMQSAGPLHTGRSSIPRPTADLEGGGGRGGVSESIAWWHAPTEFAQERKNLWFDFLLIMVK